VPQKLQCISDRMRFIILALTLLTNDHSPLSAVKSSIRVNHCSSSCSTQWRVLQRGCVTVFINNPYADYLILSGVPICLAEFSAGQIGTRRTQEGSDSHAKALLPASPTTFSSLFVAVIFVASLYLSIFSLIRIPLTMHRENGLCAVYRCQR
jgi:hypothetical protein